MRVASTFAAAILALSGAEALTIPQSHSVVRFRHVQRNHTY